MDDFWKFANRFLDRDPWKGFETLEISMPLGYARQHGAYEIAEDDKGTTLTIEIPGCETTVVVKGVELVVTAKKGEKSKDINFGLSAFADVERISAETEKGVLTIRIPKKESVESAPREIKVVNK